MVNYCQRSTAALRWKKIPVSTDFQTFQEAEIF